VKSLLYLELLPRLCSGEVELLDNEKLVNQLAGLERRTRSGGRDVIDHASNGHDDLANVVAGVADLAGKRRMMVGGLGAFGGNGVGVGDPTIARRALAAAVSANSSSNRSFV
jgi:hypothetical protein